MVFFPGEMCGKGYARMNEFQAHESSYDHSHRMVRFALLPPTHSVASLNMTPQPKLIYNLHHSASKK
jgi:hypothetical protein